MPPPLSPVVRIVSEVLGARRAADQAPEGYRRAAVLLPLYETPAGPHLLLCQRTEAVPTHKGQIGFPGGGAASDDPDLAATALREAQEEIGLPPGEVTLLGRLDDTLAVSSRHVVRPFVGLVPHPYPYRLDPFEVVEILPFPLRPLLHGAPFREEVWEREGRSVPVLFTQHAGRTVWGLTARILKQFVDLLREPLARQGLLGPAGRGGEGLFP